MTPQLIDLTGKAFGFLTVIAHVGLKEGKGAKHYWLCRCECGNEREVTGTGLKSGEHMSCGCISRKTCAEKLRKYGDVKADKLTEYRIWKSMKARCLYSNRACWKDYGGRGITVCQRWQNSFEAFMEDMGPMPTGERYTIERKDVNGNYEPGNCMWATYTEQARNKRDNRLLTFNGETRPLAEWGEVLGISYKVIGTRINRYGWSVERALTEPTYNRGRKPKSPAIPEPE